MSDRVLTSAASLPRPLANDVLLPLLRWAALLAGCIGLLAPLFVADVPPLLDYPNHLARAVILAFPDDPWLARMAQPHWILTPNLGLDLLLPPLLHLLPVHDAGRVAIGLAVLLPVAGCIAYSRASGCGSSWWPYGAALVAYNQTLLQGFVNFDLSLGVALLLTAAWVRWREDRPRLTVACAALGAVGLFFCHLMGLAFFALLAGAHEADRALTDHRLVRRGMVLAAVLLPSGLLYLASPLQAQQAAVQWSSAADKLRNLLAPFINYNVWLDIGTAVAVVAVLALAAAMRRLRCPRSSALALAALGVLFVVMPDGFKGTWWLDTRFVIMTGFLLFAGLSIEPGRRLSPILAMLLLVLFASRSAVLLTAWSGHAADLIELRGVIAEVPPGTRVLVTEVSPAEAPAYWRQAGNARQLSNGIRTDAHLPALLLIEHRAFWPFLFDDPSQQPVTLRPPYRELARRLGGLPDHLAVAGGQVDLCGYDAVLLLDAGGEPDLTGFAADRLQLLRSTDYAALFRVRESGCR